MEAHVSDVTQILNPRRDVRTDLELVGHGVIRKRGGERGRAVEKVKGLGAYRDQGARGKVSDSGYTRWDRNSIALQRVHEYFL